MGNSSRSGEGTPCSDSNSRDKEEELGLQSVSLSQRSAHGTSASAAAMFEFFRARLGGLFARWLWRIWMMMSGTSTGRKELIYERRETSLVGGNGVQRRETVDKAVQFRANMDLGSGDSSDYFIDIQTNSDSFNSDLRYESYDYQTIPKSHVPEVSSSPPPLPRPPTPPAPETPVTSVPWDEDSSDHDHFFKGKENKSTETKNATLAVVEDNKQPRIAANESNPTVPSPAEPSKTSTLRLSDRTRSESEDDIEKMDEPEQDGAVIGHKTLHKTTAATRDAPGSEKMDKNGNRSEADAGDADNDCIVQCLYYTIQCCECVIF